MANVKTNELTAGDLVDALGNDSSGRTRREGVAAMVKRVLRGTTKLTDGSQAATAPKRYLCTTDAGEVVEVDLGILASYLSNLIVGDTGGSLAASLQRAEDWASKLGSTVDGTNYSAKYQAAAAQAAADTAATAQNEVADGVSTVGLQLSQAQQAASMAQAWASAEPGVEVAPGLQSARGVAERINNLARNVAAVPSRPIVDTAYTLAKTTVSALGDEFRLIWCKNSSALTITLPKDWNTGAAFDGSVGFIWCRILRTGAGSVTLAAEAGAAPPAVEQTGQWQGGSTYVGNSGGSSIATTRSISVPAGNNRKLWIAAFDINDYVTNHVLSCSIDVGTLVLSVDNTSPASADHLTEKINAASWVASLADSPVATTHVITITIPPNTLAYSYRIISANNVNAVSSPVGDSTEVATTTQAVAVTAPVSGLVLAAMASVGNDSLPATIAGVSSGGGDSAFSTGTNINKDIVMIGGRILPSTAGVNTMTATFAISKKHAWLGVCFEKATTGGASTTVVGTTVVPSNGWLDVIAASDGRTYIVM